MRFCIIFLIAFPLNALCQTYYAGVILSKSTKKGIPYASIGLLNQNNGTTSDEKGNFRLVSKYFGDSLLISAVGYKTVKVAGSEIVGVMKFELEENTVLLSEVVIVNKPHTNISTTLNDFNNCGFDYYSVGLGTYSQIAQHFYAPHENMQLIKLRICKLERKAIFRVRIYEMDSITRKPSNEIVLKNILVNSENRNVYLDLESDSIFLTKRDFFIAIEWLFISSNEFKVKTKINGRKIVYSNYSPSLTFKRKINIILPNHLWMLNFNGKWQNPVDFDSNHLFMISADLKN
ncbi:MAG: carboxypeptidase-like regulatory domain-containing protein [Ferruginibacter sp.]